MVVFPPCKINLGLHVIRKRSDGYHDIDTCFYPIPWTDVLEIIPAENFSFNMTGTVIPGNADDNLCVRAYRLLAERHDLPPVSIHLHKVIPTGAGLGGGSSDAAWVLRVLNNLFNLRLDRKTLASDAEKLGSDCAFFIGDEPMIGTGRGEILEPTTVSLKGKFLMLVKPDVHVSTAQAYAGITPEVPVISVREIVEQRSVNQWRALLKNDFEATVLPKFPVIADVKDKLYSLGADYACMSGSGSTVFGIFPGEVDDGSFSQHTVWKGWL